MFSQYRHFALALVATSLITLGLPAWSQNGEQVLSEVGVAGEKFIHGVKSGFGVVRPDLVDKVAGAAYTDWVAPAGSRDYRAFAISSMGTALVLDGTTIREFSSKGEPITGGGFPKDVATLKFEVPKECKTGVACASLTEVTAFTALNDGSLRIAGKTRGGGFVIIAYGKNPDSGLFETKLAANGTPPTITDLDSDEYTFGDDSRPAYYWAVGEKKKVIRFPVDSKPFDNVLEEQAFTVVATLNGKTIDSVTSFPDLSGLAPVERPVVVLNTGEILRIDLLSGASYSEGFVPTTCPAPGRNDIQKYTLRGDPAGGVLFAGNRWCRTVTLYGADLVQLPESVEGLVDNPFELVDFSVAGLDWQVGQGGDFADCGAAQYDYNNPPPVTPDGVCQLGKQQNQAALWDVKVVERPGLTGFRMFQFNLVDCRQTDDDCPAEWLVECPDGYTHQKQCALNLTELLIDADTSGAFEDAAFGDETPPLMLIPASVRGEECFPSPVAGQTDLDAGCEPGKKFNDYRFHSLFAVNESIFKKTAIIDVKIDEFRGETEKFPGQAENDECALLTEATAIDAINETANLILYNNGDEFGTVPVDGGEYSRSSIIVNSGCNGTGAVRRFSAYTVGLEFYCDSANCDANDDKRIYVEQAGLMIDQLQQVKDQLICSAFPNPYGVGDLGPLLQPADCNKIQGGLGQLGRTFATCESALTSPTTGGSQENCNAFFTKVNNLRAVLDGASWPDPETLPTPLPGPLDPRVLLFKPNYEGEIYQRLTTLEFFVRNYMINSAPFPPPAP